jgi:tRNA threonylcarbamoyladenosine biosynthesis protein TsaB
MGEVYHAAYERTVAGLNARSAPGVYRPEAVPVAADRGWTGCGSGFAAHGTALQARLGEALGAVRPDVAPTAVAMLRLARPRFERGEGGDAASAAPIYLRDKVALKTSERA